MKTDFTTLDNLLATFWFWGVITNPDKHKTYKDGITNDYLRYIDDKSERYFGLPINHNYAIIYSQLKGVDDKLSEKDVMNIIEATDKIWGYENIYFDFTMYGVPENDWFKTKDELEQSFLNGNGESVMSVLCGTFGVHIGLADIIGEIFDKHYKKMARNMKLNTLI